ncbi:uncharacterized protein PAC_07595 [Phialocephala subalpina]|uniref:protein disulfide-isomerase n=1 Tax=Phialocephala subalpina TaxID=576137 RepID=A0A1L7WY57_9HELO|nr:uncharacterized protein PAC_07595 [Phialocephala subalpina]
MSPRWNHFKPTFEQIATNLLKNGTQCAVVDIDKSYDLVQRLDIDGGAPSLYLFQEGVHDWRMYGGALREKESKISALPLATLLTLPSRNHEVPSPTELRTHSNVTPDNLESFCAQDDPEFAAAEGILIPSIAVYKNFDDGKVVKWFSTDVDAMAEFILNAARPLIREFLPELHDDLLRLQEGVPLGTQSVMEALARAHKSRIHFGTWDISQYAEMDEDLRLIHPTYPAFAIREPIKNHRFPLNASSLSLEDTLPDFVSDFLNGNLHPSVRSAPAPIQTSPVIEIVATAFEEVVLDPKKDKLAKLYGDDERWKDKVVIAKMDAEENYVPEEELRMFPTFRLYSANYEIINEGERKPWEQGQGYDWEEYREADRSVESLAKFIEENWSLGARLNLEGQ